MVKVWCVRAEGGEYTQAFLDGGYIAIGWELPDLTEIHSEQEVRELYRGRYPRHSAHQRGNAVASISAFKLLIQAWDFVITPAADNRHLRYGIVRADPSYFYLEGAVDGCPYPHRRRVIWSSHHLRRSDLPDGFQRTMRGRRTAFEVRQRRAFLSRIGLDGLHRWPALQVIAVQDLEVMDE